jgi:hypothetical protein
MVRATDVRVFLGFVLGVLASLIATAARELVPGPQLWVLRYRRNIRALQKRLATISAEGYVEKMKERAVMSLTFALFLIALGLFCDEIGSLSAGPIVSKYRVPASIIFLAAAVLFLRGGAAANHGWLPATLEKHKRYLKSQIQKLEQRLPPPTPLPPRTDQVPTMPASSDEAQGLPEPRK